MGGKAVADDYDQWSYRGLCRGRDEAEPNLFFPDGPEDPNIDRAKSICAACVVQAQCLDYAFRFKIEAGIWGGFTPWERTRQVRNAYRRARRAKGGS